MSPRRLWRVFLLDLGFHARRPLFWILAALILLLTYGLSQGNVRVQSGDASVGGEKAWITSEFAASQMLIVIIASVYSFFAAVAAGMALIRDRELQVGELLHATPLCASEYVWGKFLAALAAFAAMLGLHLLFIVVCNHLLPAGPLTRELRGPLDLLNYVRPMLFFGLPALVFIAGTSFAVGEWSKRAVLVFFLPVGGLLVSGFFLWSWNPAWLDSRLDRFLQWIDPAGVRWLNHVWLDVDRGARFYNHNRVGFDVPFLVSRSLLAAIGLASVAVSQWHFARTLRGATGRRLKVQAAAEPSRPAAAADRPLAELGMIRRPVGFLSGGWSVARAEMWELAWQPGMYLFVPLILLITLTNGLVAVGAFDTPLLLTPGGMAVSTLGPLTLTVCLLLMFYTVESLVRERATGFAPLFGAASVSTPSIVAGKVVANGLVGVAIALATLAGCLIALAWQRTVPMQWSPFVLVWGVLLGPTFLAWSAFCAALLAVTRGRYTTYAVGFGVLAYTVYKQVTGEMNWVGNWMLTQSLRWTDMGTFELDRQALLLNRLAVLSLAVLFGVIAIRFYARRDLDAIRLVHLARPLALVRATYRHWPWAACPIALGLILWFAVDRGYEGSIVNKSRKDYWKQNLATWKDAPLPRLAHVDLELRLEPSRRWFRSAGTYRLENDKDALLPKVVLTGGTHWRNVRWQLNGGNYTPENRSGLFVFAPARPLGPGENLEIGFTYEGVFPEGISENGGGASEFILPSGVVLTSFSTSFVPMLGYQEGIGVEDENRYETKIYPDDYYRQVVRPALGTGRPFTTRVVIEGPLEYQFNSVGTRREETVQGAMRRVVWESDYPVNFFNVVAGRWDVRQAAGSAVYFHPEHTYNIDEISRTLEASRRYYSEWFAPYPWKELKLSEFPNLASYAQGFPTNITFSEGIGFLTRNDPASNAAFVVAAHEAAHQWWGNLLVPGDGPGGNILSEGMAHYSTILLAEQVLGPYSRIAVCKQLEESYNRNRQLDAERPLVKIDGSKDGDQTVTYDKGGWVMWMVHQHLGRQRTLAALQEFIRRFQGGPDYPLIEDLVDVLASHAEDAGEFRNWSRQWFFEVVVPEFKVTRATKTRLSAGAIEGPSTDGYEVAFDLANAGSATLDVPVAAVRGERFLHDGKPNPAYQEARVIVPLGPGQSAQGRIVCPFDPQQVIVDPDAVILQLRRKQAMAPVTTP